MARAKAISSALIAAALMNVSGSAFAQSGDGQAWQYSQYNDDNNKGASTALLAFGVPETDQTSLIAKCDNSTSDSFSAVTLAADIRGLSPRQRIYVSFDTGGFRTEISGNVTPQNFEEGVSGVELLIDNNSQLWTALKQGLRLRYVVNGQSNFISLRGSFEPIQKFVQACNFYASVQSKDLKPVNNAGDGYPVPDAVADGFNTNFVVISNGGNFADQGNGTWKETNAAGVVFNFQEVTRNQTAIFLRDESRGVSIQLNIKAKDIRFSDDTGRAFTLYQIERAMIKNPKLFPDPTVARKPKQSGSLVSSTFVEYLCDTNIILGVRYENTDQESYASWSLGTSKGTRLTSAISGSGSRYTDGKNELHTKGDFAFFESNGQQHRCNEIKG